MLAVIQDLVSVQMIASLGGDVKPLPLSSFFVSQIEGNQGRIQGEGAGGAHPPPDMTCGFVIQLVFFKKKLCGLLVLK